MKSRQVSGDARARIHVVVLDTGEEAFSALTRLAAEANISAASLHRPRAVGWIDPRRPSAQWDRQADPGSRCHGDSSSSSSKEKGRSGHRAYRSGRRQALRRSANSTPHADGFAGAAQTFGADAATF